MNLTRKFISYLKCEKKNVLQSKFLHMTFLGTEMQPKTNNYFLILNIPVERWDTHKNALGTDLSKYKWVICSD